VLQTGFAVLKSDFATPHDAFPARNASVEVAHRRCGLLEALGCKMPWTTLADLRVPGFEFHALRGSPKRYSLHVNGPWCITFEWIDGDAWRVDLEQYH